tara:strand:+ start:1243 stop:1449 length:207 start_codon:yes stop_codon:yes gene_type:complete
LKLEKLYKNWAAHNFIGHPLMQAFYILKMESAAKFVHDNTLPNIEEKPIHVPYVKKHSDIKEEENKPC